MKLTLLVTIVILLFVASLHADRLILSSGDTLYGGIIAEKDSGVAFDDGRAGERLIRLDSIQTLHLDEGKNVKKMRLGLTEGTVTVYRAGQVVPVSYGAELRVDDSIVTGDNGMAELFLHRNDMLCVIPGSKVSIASFIVGRSDRVFARSFLLQRGHVIVLARADEREAAPIEVQSPDAAVTVSDGCLMLAYAPEKRTTSAHVLRKDGTVGFRPTRMQTGEVVLRENSSGVFDGKAGTISEELLEGGPRAFMEAALPGLSKKSLSRIQYPRKPINKKWLYITGGGLLVGGGLVAILTMTNSQSTPTDATTIPVTIKW